MRKEVIFAIIIGLILGGVILYGLKLANQSTQEASPAGRPPNQSPAVTPLPSGENQFIVNEPADHAVVNTATIRISGKTQPDSSIAIESEADDALVTADADGNFSTEFKLAGGENLISLTVLLSDQTTKTVALTVIYSTAQIN